MNVQLFPSGEVYIDQKDAGVAVLLYTPTIKSPFMTEIVLMYELLVIVGDPTVL